MKTIEIIKIEWPIIVVILTILSIMLISRNCSSGVSMEVKDNIQQDYYWMLF